MWASPPGPGASQFTLDIRSGGVARDWVEGLRAVSTSPAAPQPGPFALPGRARRFACSRRAEKPLRLSAHRCPLKWTWERGRFPGLFPFFLPQRGARETEAGGGHCLSRRRV